MLILDAFFRQKSLSAEADKRPQALSPRLPVGGQRRVEISFSLTRLVIV